MRKIALILMFAASMAIAGNVVTATYNQVAGGQNPYVAAVSTTTGGIPLVSQGSPITEVTTTCESTVLDLPVVACRLLAYRFNPTIVNVDGGGGWARIPEADMLLGQVNQFVYTQDGGGAVAGAIQGSLTIKPQSGGRLFYQAIAISDGGLSLATQVQIEGRNYTSPYAQ